MEYADWLLAARHFREAGRVFHSMLGHHPDQPGVLIRLARCFYWLGDWAGMQAAFEAVLGLDPSHAEARRNLVALREDASSKSEIGEEQSQTWFECAESLKGVQQDLVFDVGMNNGDDTAYYLHRGYRVVAVEADPDLCEQASVRFAEQIRMGRLQLVNLGIAAQPGTLEFWICEQNRVWNSFDRRIASRDGLPHHRIQIPSQTFGWLLARYGIPYYLKIDIEGHDYLCIDALRDSPDVPVYLSVELGNIDRFVGQLSALGYDGFKCISQYYFIPLELPPTEEQQAYEAGKTTTLRQHGDWNFSEGSSGAFAEDTRGRWLDALEVLRTHRHYAELRQRQAESPFWFGKGYSFWLDLHARRSAATRAGCC